MTFLEFLLPQLHADLSRINDKLDRVLTRLENLKKQGEIMANQLDALKTQVEATKTVSQSAIVLLQGLKAKLDEAIASGDPAALQQLADDLGANAQALAAAITTNTPAP